MVPSLLMAATAIGHATPQQVPSWGQHSKDDVVAQPPHRNGPGISDPTGMKSSCEESSDTGDAAPATDYGQSDAILLHSGQEVLTAVDFDFAGVDHATDLSLKRRHISRGLGQYYFNTFGDAWAFNFQRRLWWDGNSGELVEQGFHRNEYFRAGSTANVWNCEGGGTDRFLVADASNGPRIVKRGGIVHHFSAYSPVGGGHYQARLLRVESPNPANTIEIEYVHPAESYSGPDYLQIAAIVDSFGRRIDFHYEDSAFPLAVTRIEDFDDREYTYEYESGMYGGAYLVRVTTPETSEFPAGTTTSYTYPYKDNAAGADMRLRNSIGSVIEPNQFGTQHARLEWTYYDTNISSSTFGWVKSHTVGNTSVAAELAAGGTYQYSYTVDPILGSGNNPATTVVTTALVNDRRGIDLQYEFTRSGQILRETVLTDIRGTMPSGGYVKAFEYQSLGAHLGDATGNLVAEINPLTDETTQAFQSWDSSAGPQPSWFHASRANRVEVEMHPDSVRGSAGNLPSLRTSIIYEPVFNKPYKVIDPRGFAPGNSEEDFTTTYIYDYMQAPPSIDPASPLAGLAARYSLNQQELVDRLLEIGVPSGGHGDVNDYSADDGAICGNLLQVRHPLVKLPGEALAVMPSASQSADREMRYNAYSQLIWERDEEGNVHESTYYAQSNWWGPSGSGSVAPEGAGGFLRSKTVNTTNGAESYLTRNSGHPTAAHAATDFYRYDTGGPSQVGQAVYRRQTPTTVIDARGVEHDFEIDEMDMVQAVVRAARVASGSSNLVAHAYRTEYDYDANGNMVEERVEERDNFSGLSGWTRNVTTYDIQNQQRSTVTAAGTMKLTKTWEYDASGNPTKFTSVDAVSASASSSIVQEYDERNLLMSTTVGAGSPVAAETTYGIDHNGNRTSKTDADSGADGVPDVTLFVYDGYNQTVKTTYPDGTFEGRKYDAVGNVVMSETYGPINLLKLDSVGGAVTGAQTTVSGLLERRHTHFDARNRVFQSDEEHFHYDALGLGIGQSQLDSGALGNPSDGLVSSVFVHDRLGRLILVVDSDGDTDLTHFDGGGRLLYAKDAEGSELFNAYDPTDNLVSVLSVERSDGQFDSLFYQYGFDSLDRAISETQPNGQKSRTFYDSRGSVVRTVDALGNTVDMYYDRARRNVEQRTYLASVASGDGVGAAPGNVDLQQGGDPNLPSGSAGSPDGVNKVSYGWDTQSRVKSCTDDRGNVTNYFYDQQSRRTGIQYGDGTSVLIRYNLDGEPIIKKDQAGFIWRYSHDSMGRRLSETNIAPGGASYSGSVNGTSKVRYSYDGLGNVWSHYADNDRTGNSANDVLTYFRYDSLGRKVRQSQLLGLTSGNWVETDMAYQGSDRLVSQLYSNNRTVAREYDKLDRVKLVQDHLGVIATKSYIGPVRTLGVSYRNGTALSRVNSAGTGSISSGPGDSGGFDINGRTVRTTWTAPSTSAQPLVASYVSTYNGLGGVGTDRISSETREHFGYERDDYQFDSTYRMVGFSPGGGGAPSSRKLDGADNMVAYNDGGNPQLPEVDGQPSEAGLNQYTSFSGRSFTYDSLGNRESVVDTSSGQPITTYSFDSYRRIDSASTGAGYEKYVYDGVGRRVAILDAAGGLKRRFAYDSKWCVLEEFDSMNNLAAQYVDGDGVDEHLQLSVYSPDGAVDEFYYHCNAVGFIGALTDSLGDTVERYRYSWLGETSVLDSAGNPVGKTSLVGNPYMFQGRRYDAFTDTYHFRRRQYDAAQGRFLSTDPTGLWQHGQGNGYSAFDGDPWNVHDTYGGESETISHQWHHEYPDKFHHEFASCGIDIDGPSNGLMLKGGEHQTLHGVKLGDKNLVQHWEGFWDEYDKKGRKPTKSEIRAFRKKMRKKLNAHKRVGKIVKSGFRPNVGYEVWSGTDKPGRKKLLAEMFDLLELGKGRMPRGKRKRGTKRKVPASKRGKKAKAKPKADAPKGGGGGKGAAKRGGRLMRVVPGAGLLAVGFGAACFADDVNEHGLVTAVWLASPPGALIENISWGLGLIF